MEKTMPEKKEHRIGVNIAKELRLSRDEAQALKKAYRACTAQVLKSSKRKSLIKFETNDPPVTGARRPGKAKPRKPSAKK
jgi:hypothetical protein